MNEVVFCLPSLEPRLQERYRQLVQAHARVNPQLAPGTKALLGASSVWANTQAAWRFYRNPRVLLPDLAQPLLEQARSALQQECEQYGLVIHDWSALTYTHASKRDRAPIQHRRHWGYECRSALLVSDRTGQPLAPVVQSLGARGGVYSTRCAEVLRNRSRQDEITEQINYLAAMSWARPLVHIADREADSVGHYRRWDKGGHRFLVRAKAGRSVLWEGQQCLLREVDQALQKRGALHFCRTVEFHRQPAQQYVAETEVVLNRAAQPKQPIRGRRRLIGGAPLTLRLVISQVRSAEGKVLATWFLLSNVPASVSAEELALWYYWRWRVESFFKLIKSAGHEVEAWQQENALAIARRLLVASMACVLVWQLARDPSPEAESMRTFLVRLSGRQMKRTQPWTMPALLDGLWTFLNMLEEREQADQSDFERLAQRLVPLRKIKR